MKTFLQQLFTGKDNRTFDIGRVLWFEVVQAYIVISAYAIYKGGAFDALTWGSGLAMLMGAGGAALYAKAGAEPQPSSIMVKRGDTVVKQSFGKVHDDGSDDSGSGSDDNDGGDNNDGSDSGSDDKTPKGPPPLK